MTQHHDDDHIKSKVLARRMTHKEEVEQTLVEARGHFLVIAQGDQIILLTKDDVFRNLEKFKQFSRG